jgi:tRNA A37 methylthiotransferase MiaB
MLNVYVTTNGCEQAQIGSAQVEQFFRANNSNIVRDLTQADLVIAYTCGLTKHDEDDSLRLIRKMKDSIRPSARLIVWGCLPKINPRSLTGVYEGPLVGPKGVDFFEKIIGTPKIRFDDISANLLVPRDSARITHHSAPVRLTQYMNHLLGGVLGHVRDDLWISRRLGKPIYWIRVSTGCTGHCTYCTEKCAWGSIRSRPVDEIISEFKMGLNRGYSRFFLVAEDLGAYGVDIGTTLPALLDKMVKIDVGRNYKIYLNQANPTHLINIHTDLENIYESGRIGVLGSQLQSGSNTILRLMGRSYTAEDWKQYMKMMHTGFPNILLMTHLMVGFPTESDEDFEMTMKILDQVRLDSVVIFKFSEREGIPASRLSGQVPPQVVEERYNRLRVKADLKTLNIKAQRLFCRARASVSLRQSETCENADQ